MSENQPLFTFVLDEIEEPAVKSNDENVQPDLVMAVSDNENGDNSSNLMAPVTEDSEYGTISQKSSMYRRSRVKVPLMQPAEKQEITELFNLFDTDSSGTMDIEEIKIIM